MLGTLCTAVAYLIFFTIIARAGAGYAALVTYLVPPVALGYGAIFLNEGVGVAALVGLVLILAGVTLGHAPRRSFAAGVRGGRGACVTTVEAETIGEAWLEAARRILRDGADAVYDGDSTKELALVTLHVSAPDPDDATIARLARPGVARLDAPQLHGTGRRRASSAARAPTRGGCATTAAATRSRGSIERLADPECRSAAITTFEPHTDTTYVPCISLLDFWRVSGPARARRVRALARLRQEGVRQPRRARAAAARGGRAVGCPVGTLVVHAKSAHVYEPELALMAELAA